LATATFVIQDVLQVADLPPIVKPETLLQ